MIVGLHVLTYSTDQAADRAFFKDVLGWPYVNDHPADAAASDNEAEDWLIFRTPPTELGVHPTAPGTAPTADPVTTVHLMCDDIAATVADLKAKGVLFVNDITDRGFGLGTELQLPGGSQLGLYQPKHAVAYNL